jgi:DNA-binding MarR family transcriptional regulator
MIRNRTTVKAAPGLFLQPFIVAQLSGAIIESVVEGSEVTATEYAVTSWLNVVGGATPTELSDRLGLAPTTLSAMVDRLVRKNQLRIGLNHDDGRSYRLELTARGKATNARNGERFGRAIATLRGNLEGDPDEILDALHRLEAALRRSLA